MRCVITGGELFLIYLFYRSWWSLLREAGNFSQRVKEEFECEVRTIVGRATCFGVESTFRHLSLSMPLIHAFMCTCTFMIKQEEKFHLADALQLRLNMNATINKQKIKIYDDWSKRDWSEDAGELTTIENFACFAPCWMLRKNFWSRRTITF